MDNNPRWMVILIRVVSLCLGLGTGYGMIALFGDIDELWRMLRFYYVDHPLYCLLTLAPFILCIIFWPESKK